MSRASAGILARTARVASTSSQSVLRPSRSLTAWKPSPRSSSASSASFSGGAIPRPLLLYAGTAWSSPPSSRVSGRSVALASASQRATSSPEMAIVGSPSRPISVNREWSFLAIATGATASPRTISRIPARSCRSARAPRSEYANRYARPRTPSSVSRSMRTSGACAIVPPLVASGRRIGTRAARVRRPRIVSFAGGAGTGSRRSAIAMFASSTSKGLAWSVARLTRAGSPVAAAPRRALQHRHRGHRRRDLPQRHRQRTRRAPGEDQSALRRRPGEAADGELLMPVLHRERQLRKQRETRAARGHPRQRGKARRAIPRLAHVRVFAERQGLVAETMAVLQEQERGPLELLHSRRPPRAQQRAGRRTGEDERILGDDVVVESLHPGHQRKQHRIECAIAQQAQGDLGLLLAPVQGQARIGGMDGGRDLRQQVGRNGGDDPDAQRSAQGVAQARRRGHQVLRLQQHTSRPRQHLVPRRRDQHAPPVALEDAHAERLLELRQLCAQGRLRHMAELCRLPEPSRVGDGGGVLELAKGERMRNQDRPLLSLRVEHCIGTITAPQHLRFTRANPGPRKEGETHMAQRPTLTTEAGAPVIDNQNSQTAGVSGPVLLQDHYLIEKLARFNRERIPERVVHAVGSGAYGYLEVTNKDVPLWTQMKVFSAAGKRTPVFIRFSTVAGSPGAADPARAPCG